jgi:hypothetical protein
MGNNDQYNTAEIKPMPPLSYKSLPRELTEREKYYVQFDASCQRLPPPSPPKRHPFLRPGKLFAFYNYYSLEELVFFFLYIIKNLFCYYVCRKKTLQFIAVKHCRLYKI